MRLLIVTTVHATVHAFLTPYAHHFRSLGWEVEVAARDITSCGDCVAVFDRAHDIDWGRQPWRLDQLRDGHRRISRLLADGNYDIVHTHTPVASFLTRVAAGRIELSRRPVVVYTAHGFHFHSGAGPVRNLVFSSAERIGGRWTDALVVINAEDERAALARRIVDRGRLVPMPGIGVDLERFRPHAALQARALAIRAELGVPASASMALMIAEFIPRKRHADVIEAMALIDADDLHLVCAGDGAIRAQIESLAAERGLGDRCHFLGHRRDIPELVTAANFTVLASAHEGLPRSVMESLALERAVVAPDIRGVHDLVDDQCGLLYPCGRVEDLAARLAYAAAHPQRIAELGRAGRSRMAGYAFPVLAELHEQLYAEMLLRRNGLRVATRPA